MKPPDLRGEHKIADKFLDSDVLAALVVFVMFLNPCLSVVFFVLFCLLSFVFFFFLDLIFPFRLFYSFCSFVVLFCSVLFISTTFLCSSEYEEV